MKDLGESRVILGMDIARSRGSRTLTITQERYAQKIIDRFGMTSACGQSTPMDPGVDFTVDAEPCTESYREAIGSIMYLMVCTRPDLAYPVCNLAKFVEKPTVVHWTAVKRMLRYIIATRNLGLGFRGHDASPVPMVYVDDDWAGDTQMSESMCGCAVMMGPAAVTWCARQQEVVAMSPAEAEYISICMGVKELMWIRRLVQVLGWYRGWC